MVSCLADWCTPGNLFHLVSHQAQLFSKRTKMRNRRFAMLREAIRSAKERQAMLDEDTRMQEIRQHAIGKATMARRAAGSTANPDVAFHVFILLLILFGLFAVVHCRTHGVCGSDNPVKAIGSRNGSGEAKAKPGLFNRMPFFLASVLVRRSFAACADAAFSSLMAHVYLVIGCGFIASDTAQDSKVTICATLGCFEKSFQPRGRYASSRAPAN